MPIYRYKCSSCVIEFEKIMSMRMAAATKNRLSSDIACPDCGCLEVTPLLPQTNFKLKGGGWYKDGYSNKEE